jgi:membrane protein YdbS with pleckstrin-like domain
MHCPSCNAPIDAQAKFCPRCGAATSGAEEAPRNDAAAALTGAASGPEEERPLWEGSYSPKAMVGAWVLLAVVSIAAVAVTVVLTGAGTLGVALPVVLPIVLGVLAVLWVIGIGVMLYRKWSLRYKLTTQRLIHRSGLLAVTTDRIELIDVDDIVFHQGLVERMVGVGTIRIRSSDVSHPELALRGIDGVHQVADAMDDARRKERRRRGIHIENV